MLFSILRREQQANEHRQHHRRQDRALQARARNQQFNANHRRNQIQQQLQQVEQRPNLRINHVAAAPNLFQADDPIFAQIDFNNYSDSELLEMDAADPTTKRGAKLEKDKRAATSQAKVWIIFFLLSVIFFISLRVSETTLSPNCASKNSCNCLDLFDGAYSIHVLLMFFYSAFRVKLGCKGYRSPIMSRRELKVHSRQVDLVFGVLFTVLTSVIAYGFFKDFIREECRHDTRYIRMIKISQLIMFLVSVSGLYLAFLAIAVCHKRIQVMRRLRRDPPELSSDEEDDQEFLESLDANRVAMDLEN